jgi:hypothetical protein
VRRLWQQWFTQQKKNMYSKTGICSKTKQLTRKTKIHGLFPALQAKCLRWDAIVMAGICQHKRFDDYFFYTLQF